MDEHITNNSSEEDAILYKVVTKEIIDPNTKECVKYPDTEFVLDSSGKKTMCRQSINRRSCGKR